MRTIAMPAPITIPTILRENEHSFHTHSQQIQIYSPKSKGYTCYCNQISIHGNNAFPAEGTQHRRNANMWQLV